MKYQSSVAYRSDFRKFAGEICIKKKRDLRKKCTKKLNRAHSALKNSTCKCVRVQIELEESKREETFISKTRKTFAAYLISCKKCHLKNENAS